MKLISIITPIYYGEIYINKLCSMVENNSILLLEKYPDAQIEYILVNDSPKQPIVSQQGNKYYEIKIINNEANQGIHQSRVRGILASEGKFIYMLDQDDEIEDNYLISQYNKIGSEDVIVANGFRKSKSKSNVLYRTHQAQKLVMMEKNYFYGTDMILSPGQCLLKREAIPEVWCKNILKINGCDDFALWLLLFKNNKRFTINPEHLYYHIEDSNNYSASADKMTRSFVEMCHMFLENELLERKKVEILMRRYQFKIDMKNKEKKFPIKIINILRNFDIVFYTLRYKILGYH